MPPHFHFELVVHLVKFGEKPMFMTKRVMDVYMSIYVDVAYNMAKSYIQNGWKIEKIEIRDYQFYPNMDSSWEDF